MLNTMIALKTPGVSQNIQVVLLNFIQADILMTNNWLQGLLENLGLTIPLKSQNKEETTLNFLYDSGYEVDYLLGNLGSSFVYLLLFPSIYLILGIINLLGKKFSKCLRISQFLSNFLLWDFAFMFYFSQFTPIVIACLINLKNISNSSLTEKISAYLTYVLFTFSILILVWMSWMNHSEKET